MEKEHGVNQLTGLIRLAAYHGFVKGESKVSEQSYWKSVVIHRRKQIPSREGCNGMPCQGTPEKWHKKGRANKTPPFAAFTSAS